MSNMFVKIGTRRNVRMALGMLAEFDPKILRDELTTTVYAPDGDIVFQAIRKDPDTFICRYHREVFDEGNT